VIQNKIDFQSLSWQTPMTGARFKAAVLGDKRLRFVEYTKEMAPHWCEKGHIGYVLEGRMEIQFDGGTATFNAGDGVFLPPGPEHRHMAKILSDVVRVVFVEDA